MFDTLRLRALKFCCAHSLDAAASEFYDKKAGTYTWDKKPRSREELVGIYDALSTKYPITANQIGSIEFDPDPTGGSLSMVALRFNPAGAFTTVQPLSRQ